MVSSGLTLSTSYELIEWAAAEMMGQSADAFLGTQGYAWDTQSDMLMALIGAISAAYGATNRPHASIVQ